MDYAVEGRNLAKSFVKKRPIAELLRHPLRRVERVEALRGVDLAVRRGEIFGLLGPNGAGKTTLLKILSCLILPEQGTAVVWGTDTVDANRVKPHIGLVNTDERSFYWRLTGRENLDFFATLYDVPRKQAADRVRTLLEHVGLGDKADQRFSDYSAGMKQRLSIARALLHDPPVLLMDEPTRSLDPAASLKLRRFIQEDLRGRGGKTVVIATHNLTEAEAICDRIAVLVRGKIRETGPVAQVRRWGLDERRYRLELARRPDELARRFEVVGEEPLEEGGHAITIRMPDGTSLNDVLRWLLDAGIDVAACDRVDSNLEEAFARILDAEGGGT